MRENNYQRRLIQKLKRRFPGCIILKNDSSYLQGVPDLTIFFGRCWAMLEVKASQDFEYEPNQEYYVDLFDGMSFAAVIFPQNEEDVLRDLQRAFSADR
jgi:hypothetical protein